MADAPSQPAADGPGPRPQREPITLLDDLRYIANADGVLLVEERVMIEKLAEAWDCDTGAWQYGPPEDVKRET